MKRSVIPSLCTVFEVLNSIYSSKLPFGILFVIHSMLGNMRGVMLILSLYLT